MIHHVSVGTSDLRTARTFYDPVMELLGLRRTFESDDSVGYGTGNSVFSIQRPVDGSVASAGNGVHIAFAATDRAMVRSFYEIALAHGGTCDGKPGRRPEYDHNYYAAFVRDPDGNKIEAVTFSADPFE